MEEKFQNFVTAVARCEEEVGKAIIGQKDVIRQILLGILIDGNVLLESVPGLGKTQMVKSTAKALSLEFSRIQFTPDLMPADVTGTNLIVKEKEENVFRFQKGPIFANLVLADEINRATPKTQAALLEAMQEKTVTAGGRTYSLPEPFMVLATQNPIENEGTYPLPEAQLDRFAFKIHVEFPSLSELKDIMELTVTNKRAELKPQLTGEEILEMRRILRDVPMSESVKDYALGILLATHPEREEAPEITKTYVANGASPRGAQTIFLAAKARAVLEGRYNVAFEDVDFVLLPALRHRLLPSFDAVSEGVSMDFVLREIQKELKKNR